MIRLMNHSCAFLMQPIIFIDCLNLLGENSYQITSYFKDYWFANRNWCAIFNNIHIQLRLSIIHKKTSRQWAKLSPSIQHNRKPSQTKCIPLTKDQTLIRISSQFVLQFNWQSMQGLMWVNCMVWDRLLRENQPIYIIIIKAYNEFLGLSLLKGVLSCEHKQMSRNTWAVREVIFWEIHPWVSYTHGIAA